MSKKAQIKQFVNDVEELERIKVDGVEYTMYNPADLKEEYYIKYFSARAAIIDLANKYNQNKDNTDMAESLIKNIELQNLLLTPCRELISAICQVDKNEFDELRPKVVIEIYSYVETLLNPIEEESQQNLGNEQGS